MYEVFQAFIYAIGTSQNVRRKSELSICMVNYKAMYVHGSPVKIRTLTHWNLRGRSATYPSPVLSPISILPPLSSHSAFTPAKKNSALASKIVVFKLFPFFF